MLASKLHQALITALVATILPLGVAASDSDKPEIWYQVEVIIFEQVDHYNAEEPLRDMVLSYPKHYQELFDPNFKLEAKGIPLDAEGNPISEATSQSQFTDTLESDTLLTANDSQPAEQIANPLLSDTPEQEQPFWQLDKEARQLNADAEAMDRRGDYRVLYHQAWRQPGITRKYAPWILVRGGDRYGQHFELEGSIRLIRSRYLHMETDLWLTQFSNNFGQEPEVWPELPIYPVMPLPTKTDNGNYAEAGINNHPEDILTLDANAEVVDSTFIVKQIDTLKTSRRMKRDEVHYVDHPRMGMLVTVTAYELPEPELETPAIEEPTQNSTINKPAMKGSIQ